MISSGGTWLRSTNPSTSWAEESSAPSAFSCQPLYLHHNFLPCISDHDHFPLLQLLLSHFSRVWLCATPWTVAHQAPPSLGFSGQEHWSGLPVPSPMHESEKWKWSRSVGSDCLRPHGRQTTRLLHLWEFPGKSTGVGRHCLLPSSP